MLIVKLYLANLLHCLIFFPYPRNRKVAMQKVVAIDARTTIAQFDTSKVYISVAINGKTLPSTACRKDIVARAELA
jgi:hypothetical protein